MCTKRDPRCSCCALLCSALLCSALLCSALLWLCPSNPLQSLKTAVADGGVQLLEEAIKEGKKTLLEEEDDEGIRFMCPEVRSLYLRCNTQKCVHHDADGGLL